MSKSFRCQDAGLSCGAKITGQTEEEVLGKAAEHAQKVHGVDITVSQTLVGYARSLVRDDDAQPVDAEGPQ